MDSIVDTVQCCNMVALQINDKLYLFRLFGFVARKQGSTTDNVSHLFAEMDPDQPASAIVNFVLKMIAAQKRWELTANPGAFF